MENGMVGTVQQKESAMAAGSAASDDGQMDRATWE